MYKNIVEEMKTIKFSGTVDDEIVYFKEIVQLFDQYFENKENSKKYSCDYLVQDYLNYQKNYYDDIDVHLLEITNFFRRAKVVSNNLIYEGFAIFQANMLEMGNK